MRNLLLALSIVVTSTLPTFASASTTLEPCMESQCVEYFKAYKILTKRGHSEAMATLGELYYAGYGTEKNTKQALKWFRRAAKFGVTTAQYKAGILYLQQSDFQDIDKGISLLKKASKIDFSPASLALGKVYLNGGFVVQNLPQADKWLSNAFNLNNQQAIQLAHQLKASENTEDLALPILYALVDEQQATKVSAGSLAPVNEMETITITAPQYTEYFDAEIARLNKSIPDTSSGTGSKIKGMTCAKSWGCSTEQDSDRIRDVLLSDWGLETLQFRLE
ncbi:tetratricopeptide repeat protein [Shewanella sp. 10N.261.52.F9]|uniref:tetratricopeptide repeat protein n=1 Tax=Shewanella TaxID=22 RepID=UPI00200DD1E3|nr:tetratricopeptide repeat protein [Shewanella marinintestina]MCL1145502.1 sel1 repeat family protein [Shewanella marinintestina]